jgi:hypothetical protein
MRWLATLGTGVMGAVLGLFAAGLVASLAVDWYRISSFEGGSGYFVVGMALLGGFAGLVIGVVTALAVYLRSKGGWIKTTGIAAGVIIGLATVTAAGARWFADVPPTIDGEELVLAVELRWPADATPPPRDAVGTVLLGALSGNTVRVSREGPLLFEDARQEGGRWIVPGLAFVFTARGQRLLDFRHGDASMAAFEVPLPGRPRDEHREWSTWLPSADAPTQPHAYTYRFKVVRASEPVRRQGVGPFTVDTAASDFYLTQGSPRRAARGTFAVRHRGEAIQSLEPLEALAVIGGGSPALIGRIGEHSEVCTVITAEGGTPRVHSHGPCWYASAYLLTSDNARARAWREREAVPGWLDTSTFASPGLYQLGPAILDTRTLALTTFAPADEPSPVASLPPLGLSPDERSFAWFSHDSYRKTSAIGVTDWTTSRTYTLPVNRARMRFVDYMLLSPAWLDHHFVWKRGPDGHDVLIERDDFVPLPHTGKVTLGKPGESQLYWLEPAGTKLKHALVDVLVKEFGGERLEAGDSDYELRVRLDGRVIGVSGSDSGFVAVSMSQEHGDPDAMRALARRLDEQLATGAFDALFVSEEPANE